MNKNGIQQLLTTLLAILFTTALSNDLSAQAPSLTLSLDKVPMSQAMKEIESQTKLLFFYTDKIDLSRTVSVNVNNATLSETLSQMLAGSDLGFQIRESNIVLSVKTAPQEGPRTVTGRVVDSDGNPVIGASVIVKGTLTGTSTGADGSFTIRIPDRDAVLVASFIGYNTEEIQIGERTNVTIRLADQSFEIDDVVVTAFGMKREARSLTYTVKEILPESMNAVKDPNIMNNLAGKIAGVTITQSATGVGGTTKVVMRGLKSLTGNNDPLYVIDGIPMSSFKTTQGTNFFENETGGAISKRSRPSTRTTSKACPY
ncbi:MAG: carboxypeptidase-like regulatory domain-containing protein [Rikenellaceae bacterium]|nr:carboxypeptidase-like regulatory domain-containing protein [Rikenellaceae bacterium]